jgi:hypothetical protein
MFKVQNTDELQASSRNSAKVAGIAQPKFSDRADEHL